MRFIRLRPLLSKTSISSFAQYAFASTSTTSNPRRRRALPQTSDVDLVAPPDPISNIRPIIYASPSPRRQTLNSPYSTGEFPSSNSDSDARLEDLELEWRLRRERVDMSNHRFWAGVNMEFHAQLDFRISLLPPPSDPPTPENVRRREDCLTQFYADWQASNRVKQGKWVRVWWREVWDGLRMQLRVYMARGLSRGRRRI